MPTYKSQEILSALDEKFELLDLNKLSEDQLYNVAAFCTIIIASAHPFPDGSGRAAIGVADVILRKNLGKSLDLSKVEARNNDITKIMVPGTVLMFPGKYNPNAALDRARKNPNRTERVDIPNIPYMEETNKFIVDLSASIIRSIKGFDPSNLQLREDKGTLDEYIEKLGAFYKSVSVPEQ